MNRQPLSVNCIMNSLKTIWSLFRKDLLLELRQQYTFYGTVLYVASTVFVLYLAMGQPEDNVWKGLFWMIQLFVVVNAVAKSFLQESKGRMLYFYSIAGPADFIFSKLLYNVLLMLIMSFISLILFQVMLGNPVHNFWKFLGIVALGATGLSLVFTLLAAIAAKANQNAAMMAIMGFPLIVPQLLLLMKITNIAFASVVQESLLQMILLLAALDVMTVVLSAILFPFLWKD